MNKTIKTIILRIILPGIVLVLCFLPLLIGRIQYAGYDINNEYLIYYQSFKQHMLDGTIPLWDFQSFLGNNFIASKSYYFIGDLFAYLPILLHKIPVQYVMVLSHILKLLLAYNLFYSLLQFFQLKNKTKVLFSILYIFSGFSLVFFGQPMFLTTYSLFPLLLIAIERYIRFHKIGFIYLASLLLVMANYYLFWSISMFLMVYWPIRYFMQYEFHLKPFLKYSFFAIVIYMLGALSYAVVLLPTALFLRQSPRVDSFHLAWFYKPDVYFNILQNIFSYPSNVSYSKTLFSSNYYRYDQIPLYVSFIVFPLVLHVRQCFNKRQVRLLLVAFVIAAIILVIPMGGSFMHGFAESSHRWVFMLATVFLLIAAIVFDHHKFHSKVTLLALLIQMVIVLGLLFVAKDRFLQHRYELFLFGFSIVGVFFFYLYQTGKLKKSILVVFILLEVIVNYTWSNVQYQLKYQNGYHSLNKDYFSQEVLSTLKEDNARTSIYQHYVGIDFDKDFLNNVGIYYGFNTTMGYDSVYHHSLKPFLQMINEIYWWFQVVDYDALQMLSTKYYIVKDKNELPHEQFTPLGSLGKSEYLLFEDQQYLPMGYTYVDTIPFEELYQYDYYTQLHHMKNRLVTNQQQPLSGTRSYLKDFQIQKNTIKGNIDVNGNQYLFFSIPYDEGWTCYVNGKVTPIQKAHQGFMAIYLQEGHHEITLTFIPSGLKKGMLLSVIAIVSYVIIVVLHHKYNKRRGKRV